MNCDTELLADVLQVYRPDCRYLKSAVVQERGSLAAALCELSIPAPFYIDSTGHFNAVEFNLCFNQMAYFTVAKCVKEGLMAPFADWTTEEYLERQLSAFLITDFRSRFRRPVQAQKFSGEVEFTEIREMTSAASGQRLYVMNTTCRFWDETGGQCDGTVRLAAVNLPARLARAAR